MFAALFCLLVCIFNFYVADLVYREGHRFMGIVNGTLGIINLMCVAKWLFAP